MYRCLQLPRASTSIFFYKLSFIGYIIWCEFLFRMLYLFIEFLHELLKNSSARHITPGWNLQSNWKTEYFQQARMNSKAGFIACINFVGSFQLHTPKQITPFIRKYRQVIDYLFVQKVRNGFSCLNVGFNVTKWVKLKNKKSQPSRKFNNWLILCGKPIDTKHD